MTWLLGSSTWGNITNNICQLACAEISDSLGHAPTTAERWVRDISTSYNVLRMPAANDVDIAAVHQPAMRTGYWAATATVQNSAASGTGNAPGTVPTTSSLVQTTPFTTAFATSLGRWWMVVYITVANTVSGNYSTARVSVTYGDADANTSSASTNIAPTAAGVITLPIGVGATVTLTDPSGFVSVNQYFARGFTTTYMYGIDWWPMYSRNSGTWTFATAPPGVAGTDYDIINQVVPSTVITSTGAPLGGLFSGLGIKSATGLGGGARYVFSSCPCTQLKVALRNTTGSNGYIDLLGGGISLDSVNGTVLRQNAGLLASQWLKLASTPASVTTAMTVQYWMSVTATGIAIALNSDPAFTGGMTAGYFGLFTAGTAYDANDRFHSLITAPSTNQFSGGNSTAPNNCLSDLSYFRQFRCQDGSHGTRDWQTYWMRADFNMTGSGSMTFFYALDAGQTLYFQGNPTADANSAHPSATPKPGFDGNWWLYGYSLMEGVGGGSLSTFPPTVEQAGFMRGAINDRWWHLPGVGWANGDELTDTSTSQKYFLVAADSPGFPGKYPAGSNVYVGGNAIAEV